MQEISIKVDNGSCPPLSQAYRNDPAFKEYSGSVCRYNENLFASGYVFHIGHHIPS